MKKYFYFTAMLAVFSVFGFYACNDIEQVQEETSDHYSQTSDLIIGSFNTNGDIVLNVTQQEVEQIFLDYCLGEGYSNASFTSATIEDYEPNDPQMVANFEIMGTYEDLSGNFTTITMGMELEKDYEEYVYAAIGTGAKWDCAGKNCAACKPTRNNWGKVTDCICLRAGNDNTAEPPACVHSTNGGGSGPGWAGIILAGLGLLLAD